MLFSIQRVHLLLLFLAMPALAQPLVFDFSDDVYQGIYKTPTDAIQGLIFAPPNTGSVMSGRAQSLRIGRSLDSSMSIAVSYQRVSTSSSYIYDVDERIPGGALFPYVFSDTDVEASQEHVGLSIERSLSDTVFNGSSSVSLEYVQLDIDITNDFDFGGALVGRRSQRMSDDLLYGTVGIRSDVISSDNFSVGLSQRYGLPLSGDSMLEKSGSFGLVIGWAMGGAAKQSSATKRSQSCSGFDFSAGDSLGSLSGHATASPDDYIGTYHVDDGVSLRSHTWHARYFVDQTERSGHCWTVGVSGIRKQVDLQTGQIDNLLGTGRAINSRLHSELDGYQLSVGYALFQEDQSPLYVIPSFNLAYLTGDTTQTSSFGSVLDVAREKTEVYLPSISFTNGLRFPLDNGFYAFYELTTTRYDGRPFDHDVHGWEHSLNAGVGKQF